MTDILRIGTRDSQLAMWQAEHVQQILKRQDIESKLVPIKSQGDLNREQPIYELGTTGVFTKALDDALLNDQIDVAVHSLKDVPTLPAEGLIQGAVLERSAHSDVLITSAQPEFLEDNSIKAVIATGSLRRRSQWLHRYPHHEITGIRGNVDTRLKKLESGEMDGTILSFAGLKRLTIQPEFMYHLSWMIPAPAQGVMGIFCRTGDQKTRNLLIRINNPVTEITSLVERQVLRTLEGGCTAPIGAYAFISENQITVKACLLNLKGTKKIEMQKTAPIKAFGELGKKLALAMIEKGGREIIEEIKAGE